MPNVMVVEHRWRPLLNAAVWLMEVRQGKGCTSPRDRQTSCTVWLTSIERRRCSNEANMQNTLKFAGVPQTPDPISAANGLTFTILCGHVEEILLFNKFFSTCQYMP